MLLRTILIIKHLLAEQFTQTTQI